MVELINGKLYTKFDDDVYLDSDNEESVFLNPLSSEEKQNLKSKKVVIKGQKDRTWELTYDRYRLPNYNLADEILDHEDDEDNKWFDQMVNDGQLILEKDRHFYFKAKNETEAKKEAEYLCNLTQMRKFLKQLLDSSLYHLSLTKDHKDP